MEVSRAILVLADISGYTKFVTLHTMSLLHAEKIVSELMEVIIDRVEFPMVLNKLEGDALLLYAEVGEEEEDVAGKVLQQALVFFDAFRSRSKELTGCRNLCPCDACREADELRLKTIIHTGEVALKKIGGFTELAGPSVILAHRLMKNSLKSREYLILTDDFLRLLSHGATSELVMEERKEVYEELGEVKMQVYFPPGGEEEAEGGVTASPDQEGAPTGWSLVSKRLVNAWKLDAYGVARALKWIPRPERLGGAEGEENTPNLRQFSKDGLEGLKLVFGKKR